MHKFIIFFKLKFYKLINIIQTSFYFLFNIILIFQLNIKSLIEYLNFKTYHVVINTRKLNICKINLKK